MERDDISYESLSAYVDGELDAKTAAVIARRAASDPEVAARLANLQEMRAGVASFVATGDVPPRLPIAHLPKSRGRMAQAFCGAVAIVVVAGVFLLAANSGLMAPHEQKVAGTTAVQDLVDRHDEQRFQTVGGTEDRPASAQIVRLMEATGLRLTQEILREDSIRQSVFVGANGCRLSLFELPRGERGLVSELELSIADELLTAQWQGRTSRYVLIARAMDQVRFATIASSMHAATTTESVPEADLVASLAGARQRCQA